MSDPKAAVRRAIHSIDKNSPTAVARALGHGMKRQHIEHWFKVGRVPADRVALLAQVSGVPVWELCPNDWFVIFPMLVNQEGAPAVPLQQQGLARADGPDEGLR